MTKLAKEIHSQSSQPVVDAVSFLGACQRNILDLFNQYNRSSIQKHLIAREICNALMINMQIEEEIFHPAVKKAVKENGSVSAATMEHSILKYLISEIASLDADSSVYDIKMKVLGEQVKEHFARKQLKLFPKALSSRKLDLWALGAQLAWRRQELAI